MFSIKPQYIFKKTSQIYQNEDGLGLKLQSCYDIVSHKNLSFPL